MPIVRRSEHRACYRTSGPQAALRKSVSSMLLRLYCRETQQTFWQWHKLMWPSWRSWTTSMCSLGSVQVPHHATSSDTSEKKCSCIWNGCDSMFERQAMVIWCMRLYAVPYHYYCVKIIQGCSRKTPGEDLMDGHKITIIKLPEVTRCADMKGTVKIHCTSLTLVFSPQIHCLGGLFTDSTDDHWTWQVILIWAAVRRMKATLRPRDACAIHICCFIDGEGERIDSGCLWVSLVSTDITL